MPASSGFEGVVSKSLNFVLRRTCVPQTIGGRVMGRRECPVLIEMDDRQRLPANIDAPSRAEPAEVSLALRDKGWSPYRIWFDSGEDAWIAAVIYRPDAA